MVLITSYFLCLISSLYATGSLITLEATSFFCPVYSAEEVRQHSVEIVSRVGASIWSCWFVNRKRLNYEAIFELDINIFSASIDINTLTFFKVFQTLSYSMVVLILLIATLHHTYLFIYDTMFAILSRIQNKEINPRINERLKKLTRKDINKYKQHGTKNNNSQQTDDNMDGDNSDREDNSNKNSKNSNTSNEQWSQLFGVRSGRSCCFCCWLCESILHCCFRCKTMNKEYYSKYVMPFYYVDSKWKILNIIFREWFEILVQFYALLLYGGINIFSPNSNVLSQEPYVIQAFVIIISLNCITSM